MVVVLTSSYHMVTTSRIREVCWLNCTTGVQYYAGPEALADIFSDCLAAGIHPWREVTVVAINKPFKPDYSKLKAY